ncbi:MAG: helix-turn-helix domain-containing protein [Kordiimonas sp.]
MTEIKLAKFARVPPSAAMDKTLSKAALKVLIALCGHADRNDLCRPTQSRLALASNLSRQHVNRALQELCSQGWITLAGKRRGSGRWPSNVYRINFENAFVPAITKPPCHPKGDTDRGTSEVTLSRRPIGDTNKSINRKREQKGLPAHKGNPYKILLRELGQAGLNDDELLQAISKIDPSEYESFCEKVLDGRCPTKAALNLLSLR